MNKQCYRVIFNAVRGLLMVVADIARTGAQRLVSGHRAGRVSDRYSLVVLAPLTLGVLLAIGGSIQPAVAAIHADGSAPGNQQPTVINSASGIPQVNIQTPSAAGVSRNVYRQFDVESQGAILNNSRKNTTTQLAGMVAGNPWLAKGEARIILNEVNSRDPSRLQGYLEVAGKQAQVIIANPAGITCRGCGFINANRATLTTGKALLNQGALQGFNVEQGSIVVEGRGLDSTRQDYTDLIARTVQLNGKIWAKNLRVTAGRNRVDAAHQQISRLADSVEDRPQLAIDVASLGGMYAGKIRLIGTEDGVGVHNAGSIGAQAGDVVIRADGQLENRGTIHADQQLLVNSQGSLTNQGSLSAGRQLQVSSGQLTNQHGKLVSGEQLQVTSLALNNTGGLIQADGDAVIDSQGQQLINRDSDVNSGIRSGGNLTLHTGDMDNQRGMMASGKNLTVQAKALNNRQGTVLAKGNGHIETRGQLNNQHGVIQSDNLTINSQGQRLNNTSGQLYGKQLQIASGQLENRHGQIAAQQQLWLQSALLNNQQGSLSSEQGLRIESDTIANGQGIIHSGQQGQIEAGQLSGDGQLLSQGDLTIHTQQAFNNQSQVLAKGNLRLRSDDKITNQQQIAAGNQLTLQAKALVNQASGQITGQQSQFNLDETLTNVGLIDGEQTQLRGAVMNNLGTGRIYGDDVVISSDTFNNLAQGEQSATVAGRNRLTIGSQTINNQAHSLLYSGGDLLIGGQLDSNGYLRGQAQTVNNHSASIEANGNLSIAADQLNNINDHFTTQIEQVDEQHHLEYQPTGSTHRWQPEQISISYNQVGYLKTPESDGPEYSLYDYHRIIQESRIKESDPAKILAGENATLQVSHLLNDKSQVVAGKQLAIKADSIDNVEVPGKRLITDQGVVNNYWRIKKKHKSKQGYSASTYAPPTVIQDITLTPSELVSRAGQTPAHSLPEASTLKPTDPAFVPWVAPEATDPQSGQRLNEQIIKLPSSSLFTINPAVDEHVLVQTDPRFTNQRAWLSSDYMQNALTLDAGLTQKRLGDGYYEQQLVREQVINLTGQRYLAGYHQDEQQFKSLMDAGIAFGQRYQLQPGVALSAAQMALLSQDMVWLVEKTVTLADGREQQVLAPQLYLRQVGDIDGSGALLAGKQINIHTEQDIHNSGRLVGQQLTVTAMNITNQQGFIGGDTVSLQALGDINNLSDTFAGQQRFSAIAARDIHLISSTTQSSRQLGANQFARAQLNRLAGVYLQGRDGQLQLQAGRDLQLTAAQMINQGNGDSQLTAGHDLILNTVTTGFTDNLVWDDNNRLHQQQRTQQGSELVSRGALSLNAGHDIRLTAANLSSDEQLRLHADNDIQIHHGIEQNDLVEHHKHTSHGFLSKKTVITDDQVHNQLAKGSRLQGDSLAIEAGGNAQIVGSELAAEQQLTIDSVNNLAINAAQQKQHEVHFRQEKKSGLMGSGGIGFSIGKQSTTTTDSAQQQSQQGSTVGSVHNDVLLNAGKQLAVNGSDVIAGQDIKLQGRQVTINAGQNRRQQQRQEVKSSGLTVALSGAVGGAVNSMVATIQQAKHTKDSQITALQGIQAALTGYQAIQAGQLALSAQGSNDAVGVSVSLGKQRSVSQMHSEQTQAKGSGLSANRDIAIKAQGTPTDNSGNLLVKGSQLTAGRDMNLTAQHDLQLQSAQNREQMQSRNHSSGGSIGAGLTVGTNGMGYQLSAAANHGAGHENSDRISYQESTVNAGNNATLTSGRDTTLTGAQVSGKHITAEVGRHLTLTSQQDREDYDLRQHNESIEVAGGSSGINGSINVSQQKMDSQYQSVNEQTGLFAGKEGFAIKVGQHSQLNGAVIGSTAAKDKNTLTTGTLGFSDIENSAHYHSEQQGIGLSTGGTVAGQFIGNMANSLLTGTNHGDSDSSTTQSAISQGDIHLTDKENQQQDIATLSRDVEHANQTLSPIFNKEKEQRRLATAQLIGQIGSQASDIVRTQGKIYATQAGQEALAKQGIFQPDSNASSEKKAAYQQRLTASPAYQQAQAKYGTGSSLQRAMQAATLAIQGLAGSDLKAAIAAGSSPYLAEIIKNNTPNDGARVIAHAVVNAVLARAQGNSAAAGAAGAAVGEMTGILASNIYQKPTDQLSEEQKQTISALATLASGLSGAIIGNGAADTVAAAQAGKTTVENNSLAGDQARETVRQAAESLKSQIRDKLGEGTTSSIANGIITALANSGDTTLGGMDYVADGAMALASCAIGDSYCNKALNDLSSKNQAVADSIIALMKSETWSSLKSTLANAWNGNQAALESTGGIIASVLLPGKKIPHMPNVGAVGNMGEFFKQSGFGSEIKRISKKTSKQYQGQGVYNATNDIGSYIKKGDQFYLDAKHKDHIEIFDKRGNFRAVLNLDGTINEVKTKAAEGRKLK